MSRRPGVCAEQGLTLVELLVVVVLLSLMGLIVGGSLSSIIKARDAISAQQESYQTARAFYKRVQRELAARVAAPLNLSQPGQAEQQATRFNFLVVNKRQGQSEQDRLVFVTDSGAEGLSGGFENHGRIQIEYRLEEQSERTLGRERPTYLFVREEIPQGLSEEQALEARRRREVLADNVLGFDLRLMTEKRWITSWSEPRPNLPEAVEVTLELENADSSRTLFRTAFSLVLEPKAQSPF